MAHLQCILVTPETTVVDEPAEFVALPLCDGEIGIAPDRSPLIGRLGCGEMRIVRDGSTSRFYVEGGFVEVAKNVVSVLTSRAVPAEDLDEAVAREQLSSALSQPATTAEQLAHRQRLVSQSRAQLRIASRAD